jgi:hypothetical protein
MIQIRPSFRDKSIGDYFAHHPSVGDSGLYLQILDIIKGQTRPEEEYKNNTYDWNMQGATALEFKEY